MTIFCEIVCHETLVKKASHFVAEVMSTDFKAPIKLTDARNLLQIDFEQLIHHQIPRTFNIYHIDVDFVCDLCDQIGPFLQKKPKYLKTFRAFVINGTF